MKKKIFLFTAALVFALTGCADYHGAAGPVQDRAADGVQNLIQTTADMAQTSGRFSVSAAVPQVRAAHVVYTDREHNTCGVAGCTQTGEHVHNTCGVAGCTQTGEHVHNTCGVTGCTQAGEHVHNTCGVAGCTQTGEHSHGHNGGHHSERRGHHHH